LADEAAGPVAAVLAPLGGDAAAIGAELRAVGLTPRICADAAALDALLSEAGPGDLALVVATHEGAGAETGAALQRAHDREPSWARLPVIFLLCNQRRPPQACALLDRKENAPRFLMLDRPVRPAVLRRAAETQLEARRRQLETRDLLEGLREAEERQRFLLAELAHRTRNSFSVLHAIFNTVARRSESAEALIEAFSSRLLALTKAHGALTGGEGEQRDLAELVREHVEPFAPGPGSLRLDGPETALAGGFAFDLALVLHELAINAAKHGALSTPDGTVSVRWTRDAEGLDLVWTERGGPPVAPPTRKGLGSHVIARLPSPGSDVAVRFEPEGLVWRARIGAAALPEGP
jgi:two-component sensor histidine kinase